MKRTSRIVLFSLLVILHCSFAVEAAELSGELRTWHKITLTFEGPETHEQASPNPFLYYRLDVTFTKGDKSYLVPGYYAADGDAANCSADSGNKWRVHFAQDEAGTWDYAVSFRRGENVAVSDDPNAGASAGMLWNFLKNMTSLSGR